MPREKKYRNYELATLNKALKKIREGMGIRQASKAYGIPRGTLQNHIHNRSKKMEFGPQPILTHQEEREIAEWIINNCKKGFPRRKVDVQMSVKEFLEKVPRPTPFKDNIPGDKWYLAFLRRHPHIVDRTPEAVTNASATVSEKDIRGWFHQIEEYCKSNGLMDILSDPTRIYNGDETNFQLCAKSGKVLAPKGARNVYEIDHAKAKEAVTVMFSFAASGETLPPLIIYPYKRIPLDVRNSIPDGFHYNKTHNGWMNSDVFIDYIRNTFYPTLIERKIKFPVILYVDGHKTHQTLGLSKVCQELQIILVNLYPNATRILQPADVAGFKPLKGGWKEGVQLWRNLDLANNFTIVDFAPILKIVVENTASKRNMQNGFRVCGLYPFDANAVDYSKCLGTGTNCEDINNDQELIQRELQNTYGNGSSPLISFERFSDILGEVKIQNIVNYSSENDYSEDFLLLRRLYLEFGKEHTLNTQNSILMGDDVSASNQISLDNIPMIISNCTALEGEYQTIDLDAINLEHLPVEVMLVDENKNDFIIQVDDKSHCDNSPDLADSARSTLTVTAQNIEILKVNDLNIDENDCETQQVASQLSMSQEAANMTQEELSSTNIRYYLPTPPTLKRKGKRQIERKPFVISSEQWQEKEELTIRKKEEAEEQKRERKRLKIEKKVQKEQMAAAIKEAKRISLENKKKREAAVFAIKQEKLNKELARLAAFTVVVVEKKEIKSNTTSARTSNSSSRKTRKSNKKKTI